MLAAIDELFWVLRREGFVVSTAQAILATRAAAVVGFDDREALKGALRAVVVDRRSERAAFDRVFDRFFSMESAHATDLFGRLRERGFRGVEIDALKDLLEAIAARSGSGGDAEALAAATGADRDLDRLLLAADMARALAPMTSALQAGYFTQKLLEKIGVSRAKSAVKRLERALAEAMGEERAALLVKALEEEIERVKRRVREHVDKALEKKLGDAGEGKPKRRDDKPFTALSEREIEDVRRVVRALAERLRGGERVRRRRARRGAIDPHRTMRAALRTGGVPFAPARKKRRRDKPRLVVLCDVSDSVRVASLFMLEFTHAAQELFSGTRSFVFVSEIGETTKLFDEAPVATALARIYAGHVVSPAHNSNYGRVFRDFEARFGDAIDRRTTVVVLGDGRTNYFADEASIVARLKERARALVWITPEGPATWGSGDSAMTRYASASTEVIVARTARELEEAARRVSARRK